MDAPRWFKIVIHYPYGPTTYDFQSAEQIKIAIEAWVEGRINNGAKHIEIFVGEEK